MRVRILTLGAGPDGVRAVGSEHTVDDAEGKALVAGGYAVDLDTPAAEKAAGKKGKKTDPDADAAAAAAAVAASAAGGAPS